MSVLRHPKINIHGVGHHITSLCSKGGDDNDKLILANKQVDTNVPHAFVKMRFGQLTQQMEAAHWVVKAGEWCTKFHVKEMWETDLDAYCVIKVDTGMFNFVNRNLDKHTSDWMDCANFDMNFKSSDEQGNLDQDITGQERVGIR